MIFKRLYNIYNKNKFCKFLYDIKDLALKEKEYKKKNKKVISEEKRIENNKIRRLNYLKKKYELNEENFNEKKKLKNYYNKKINKKFLYRTYCSFNINSRIALKGFFLKQFRYCLFRYVTFNFISHYTIFNNIYFYYFNKNNIFIKLLCYYYIYFKYINNYLINNRFVFIDKNLKKKANLIRINNKIFKRYYCLSLPDDFYYFRKRKFSNRFYF